MYTKRSLCMHANGPGIFILSVATAWVWWWWHVCTSTSWSKSRYLSSALPLSTIKSFVILALTIVRFLLFFFLFFSPVAFPQVCHWSGKHFRALYIFQVVMFWDNSFHGYKVCLVLLCRIKSDLSVIACERVLAKNLGLIHSSCGQHVFWEKENEDSNERCTCMGLLSGIPCLWFCSMLAVVILPESCACMCVGWVSLYPAWYQYVIVGIWAVLLDCCAWL